MRFAVPDKLARNYVQNGVTVRYDGVKLFFCTFRNDIGKRVTVHFMRFIIAALHQLLFGAFDFGSICAVRYRFYPGFDHVGDKTCVGHDRFICLLGSEICKFFKHHIGIAEIKPGRSVGIAEFECMKKYLTIDLVILIKKMYVSGRNIWLVLLFGNGDDTFVDSSERFVRFDPAFVKQIAVIAVRHYFKIVVKVGYFIQVGVRTAVKYRTVQFSSRACGADYQPVTMLCEHRFRNARETRVVIEI